MRPAVKQASFHTGNLIAWGVTVFCTGLAVGWILNAERMYGFCVVP